MRTNPLFQEGIQVYLVEGHGFVAYFYLLLFLASLEFLTLFLPSLDPQAWMGPANLFKASSVAALMLVISFIRWPTASGAWWRSFYGNVDSRTGRCSSVLSSSLWSFSPPSFISP